VELLLNSFNIATHTPNPITLAGVSIARQDEKYRAAEDKYKTYGPTAALGSFPRRHAVCAEEAANVLRAGVPARCR
jgi:hypothetical protein